MTTTSTKFRMNNGTVGGISAASDSTSTPTISSDRSGYAIASGTSGSYKYYYLKAS
jgi:hypothetical protein